MFYEVGVNLVLKKAYYVKLIEHLLSLRDIETKSSKVVFAYSAHTNFGC